VCSIQVDAFLNQYAQIITNIGQEKGQIVKGIIKAVNILKPFVISGEPTTPSELSMYAGSSLASRIPDGQAGVHQSD
jgi:hypothetical protein